MANRIGLFGGSFDPVHIAHLIIANSILQEYQLDKMIFIPNFVSPFKIRNGTSDILHRIEMLKLSIDDNSKFELSEFEAEKKRAVFTYETIEYFRHKMPEKEFYLLLGYDSFINIKKWRNFEYILDNCKIVVVGRYTHEDFDEKDLPEHLNSRLFPLMNISSTVIRKMVLDNLDIKYLVNDKVSRYIRDKELYKVN